ncbi:MAG: sulfoxide reductase heme-binding subunit YedZ [Acidobacteriota bacterium]|nr:sulfoxide reductase heme-binding subunit YedZ [Acidobacteriota bacterium]MDQ3171542.1 sulfoxide reductase heme-binding subunit YedZ [Acidobacteriota bacterium]
MARLLKLLVFLVCLAPAGWLTYRAFGTGDLGVNPIETLTHETGQWALRLLLASLAITPIRRLTGWNRIISYRRMLGLFAFFYSILHLSIWVVFDHYFDLATMLSDVAKRPFITMGTVALLLMVPLALTSTKWAIRKMGRRWQQLHRLVYVSAIAAVLHFIWKEKVIINETLVYAAILAALLAIRVVFALRKRAAR